MEKDPNKGKPNMINALKAFVVPEIKALGFSGRFPHFRRERESKFEFLSFQFNRHGGSFILECGSILSQDLPEFASGIPFDKLNYGYTHPNNRLRIKPDGATREDFWFNYSVFTQEGQFEELAKSLVPLLLKVDQFFEKVSPMLICQHTN